MDRSPHDPRDRGLAASARARRTQETASRGRIRDGDATQILPGTEERPPDPFEGTLLIDHPDGKPDAGKTSAGEEHEPNGFGSHRSRFLSTRATMKRWFTRRPRTPPAPDSLPRNDGCRARSRRRRRSSSKARARAAERRSLPFPDGIRIALIAGGLGYFGYETFLEERPGSGSAPTVRELAAETFRPELPKAMDRPGPERVPNCTSSRSVFTCSIPLRASVRLSCS